MLSSNAVAFLTAPVLPAVAGILLVALVILLLVGRKKLKPWQLVLVGAVIFLCLLYFIFVIWLSVGFGSGGPAAAPTPRRIG